MTTQRAKNFPRRVAALAAGASIVIGGGATPAPRRADGSAADREAQLERSLDIDETRQNYHRLYDEAERLDVEPKRNVADGVARAPELSSSTPP